MAHKETFLQYWICLRNAPLVEALNTRITSGNTTIPTIAKDLTTPLIRMGSGTSAVYFLSMAPTEAATKFVRDFTLPIINVGDPIPDVGTAPVGYIQSQWFSKSNTFPRDQYQFVKEKGWWIFGGDDIHYWWAGKFMLAGGTLAPTVDPIFEVVPAPVPKRIFVDGFETTFQQTTNYTRSDARDPGGFALAFRSGAGATSGSCPSDLAFLNNAPPQDGVWERFYVRIRKQGTGAQELWRSSCLGNWAGVRIDAMPGGGLVVQYMSSGSPELGSVINTTLLVGQRYRFDVLSWFSNDLKPPPLPDINAGVHLYIDGALVATAVSGKLGTNVPKSWGVSRLGGTATAVNGWEVNYDDWRGAEIPADKDPRTTVWANNVDYIVGNTVRQSAAVTDTRIYRCKVAHKSDTALNAPWTANGPTYWALMTHSLDWHYGSSMQVIRPQAHVGATDWQGDAALLASRPPNYIGVSGELSSIVSGARLRVSANMQVAAQRPNVIGHAGFQVWTYAAQGAGGPATFGVGYALNGGAPVINTITPSSGAVQWRDARYTVGDTIEPVPTALELHYIKQANTAKERVPTLLAVIELIGLFDDADARAMTNILRQQLKLGPTESIPSPPLSLGPHCAPYPFTPWAFQNDEALAPVVIKTGTYAGNANGIDLYFSAPPTFLVIHGYAGSATNTIIWYPSQLNAHAGGTEACSLPYIPIIEEDLSYVPASGDADQQRRYRVRIGGNPTASFVGWPEVSLPGASYSYVAYSDPGRRYSLAGALAYRGSGTGALPTGPIPLDDANFTPDWMFGINENLTNVNGNNFVKGPGHTVDQATTWPGGASLASAVTLGKGTVTFGTGLNWTMQDLANIGFRRTEEGETTPHGFLQIGTYTGDGTASRTIGVAAGGRRPLWVMVQPIGAAMYMRDPTCTGTTSYSSSGAASITTAITAGGVDSFSVGTTLNTNAVLYNYIGFFVTSAACNNGWACEGEYPVVPPTKPKPPIVPVDPTVPVDPGGGGGEDDDDLGSDGAAGCVAASTRLVNLALSRIGQSAKVANLKTEQSAAASVGRTVYRTEMDAALRDFPWPFATRYATLALVIGTPEGPASPDWTYAYRAPDDCVFVRRVVHPAKQRRHDRDPIAFRMGEDDGGKLIYCNEPGVVLPADADVQIEFTLRVPCPASSTDAIFRSAAAWRLAAALAKPLGRDEKDANDCLQKYLFELGKAKLVHAQEQQHQDRVDPDDADWIKGRS